MKVTEPMIQRGAAALRDMRDHQRPALGGWYDEAEAVLRAALNDPKHKAPDVIPGQMAVEDYLRYG